MKAVVLAGGKGSRLFPLTQTRPKPLARVLDRPVLDYTFKALSDLGITEVAVTTHYLSEQIRLNYPPNFLNLRIRFFEESSPLGTAGAVKAVADFLDEDFLVLSGDAIFDFDLCLAKQAFVEKKAPVLLVLSRQSQPLEYGVVRQDTSGKILAFREKPDWQHVFSDTVNTGIYFCSRAVLDEIPADTTYDFSHDLFPKLLGKDIPIYGEILDGYWCDIGSPAALYHCNIDALQGKLKLNLPPDGSFVGKGKEKSFLSNGVRILPGARLISCVVGAGSEIHASQIRASVLERGVIVQDEAKIDTAFLCDGVNCEKNCEVRGGTVLGERCIVRADSHTRKGGLYAANTVIETISEGFFEPKPLFEEGAHSFAASPKDAFIRAYHLGELSAGILPEQMIVACADLTCGCALTDALCAGRSFAGAPLYRAILPTLESARYAARTMQSPLFYVQYHLAAQRFTLTLCDADGLCPTDRRFRFSAAQNGVKPAEKPGEQRPLSPAISDAYRFSLSSALPDLDAVKLCVFPNAAGRVFAGALTERGAEVCFSNRSDHLFFDLQENGENAILLINRSFLCDADRMRALILRQELERGKRLFALPSLLPGTIEEYLLLHGAKIAYPTIQWMDETVSLLRAECAKNAYLFDPAALCAHFLSFWHEKSAELSPQVLERELKAIPSFITTKKDYEIPADETARVAAKVWEISENGPAGPRIKTDRGTLRVHLKPGKLRFFAESGDPEAASELCDFSFQTMTQITDNPK